MFVTITPVSSLLAASIFTVLGFVSTVSGEPAVQSNAPVVVESSQSSSAPLAAVVDPAAAPAATPVPGESLPAGTSNLVVKVMPPAPPVPVAPPAATPTPPASPRDAAAQTWNAVSVPPGSSPTPRQYPTNREVG